MDMVASAKWGAWNALGDMPVAEAMQEYVELVHAIYPVTRAESLDEGEMLPPSPIAAPAVADNAQDWKEESPEPEARQLEPSLPRPTSDGEPSGIDDPPTLSPSQGTPTKAQLREQERGLIGQMVDESMASQTEPLPLPEDLSWATLQLEACQPC